MSGLLWLQSEELQIDGIPHQLVTCIVGMEMIARIIGGQECVRMVRIPHRGLEVDDAVESAAGADPVVYRLTDRFPAFGVVARAMIRSERTPNDRDAMGVSTRDHLLQGEDEVGGG